MLHTQARENKDSNGAVNSRRKSAFLFGSAKRPNTLPGAAPIKMEGKMKDYDGWRQTRKWAKLHPYYYERKKEAPVYAFIVALCIVLAFAIILIASVAGAEEIDLDIIAQIESGGNPMAYNPASHARGAFQITPVCLEDYNTQTQRPRNAPNLSVEALFNPIIARKVSHWTLNRRIPQMLLAYHIEDTIVTRLACYNWGIGRVKKWVAKNADFGRLPQETQQYIHKYLKLKEKAR